MRSRLRARFGVVVALDRLGRSLSTVTRIIKTLTAAGVWLAPYRHRQLDLHRADARRSCCATSLRDRAAAVAA